MDFRTMPTVRVYQFFCISKSILNLHCQSCCFICRKEKTKINGKRPVEGTGLPSRLRHPENALFIGAISG